MSGHVKDATGMDATGYNIMRIMLKYNERFNKNAPTERGRGKEEGARARDLPFVAEISAVSEYYAEIHRKHKRDVTL